MLSDDFTHLAQRLHPSALEIVGLVSSLREEGQDFSRREGIPVRVMQRQVPERLPLDVVLCLFRIVQEALSNVARHSRAKEVLITVLGDPKGLRLSIKDNGVGFDTEATRDGIGLTTIQERARLVNGKVSVSSARGSGTEMVVKVPLPSGAGTPENLPDDTVEGQ
jgi:signal transduction histidine kinase